MAGDALLLFIKNPRRGKVKTRLARTVGDDQALAIYRALLAHTRQVALALEVDRLLFYSEQVDYEDEWPAASFRKFAQRGDDLGQRMHTAFQLALKTYHHAVLIGSDCASLTPAILQEAFDQLAFHDYVIGPAHDGGYYLIGMREPSPALFEHMPWSTPQVLSLTLARIAALGKSCYHLPVLSDIDTEQDWLQHGWPLA